MFKRIIVFGFLMISLSCSQDQKVSMYQSVTNEELSTRPLVFDIPETVMDTVRKNVFIRLRNDNAYEFSNIFLIATLTAGDKQIVQDTLEYAMAAPDGTWLGTGFGEVKESKLWWKQGVLFPKERPIKIKISQAMRNNGQTKGVPKLNGILTVGISIEHQIEK
ncbi:MAG: gliding motility lipoprotein GldH [Flavobacteriaceae bacterium]